MLNAWAEDMIVRLPYPIRVLLANVSVFRLNRLRRGGAAYHRAFDSIDELHQTNWEILQEQQKNLLVSFLLQAQKRNPFFRNRVDDHRLRSADSVSDVLTAVRTTTKAEARHAGDAILNPELRRLKHYIGHTSGTTGTPFTFRLSLEGLQSWTGVRDGFYAYHGFDFKALNVRIGGRLFVSTSRKKPPFWIRDFVTNQLLFSGYHLGDSTMPYFVEKLERLNPRFITGYPSAINVLARGCRELGSSYKPTLVITDSETLLEEQRRNIEDTWKTRVIDYYGLEVGWIAGQCSKGKYHLSPLTSVVEILDDNLRPCAPGEIGELVITDLANPLMPLIRYRTGDLSMWSEGPCDCGWNTPTLERIEGRMDDVVVLPDGRKIGRLSYIVKKAVGVREAQLVQEELDRFVLNVVPEEGFTEEVERLLIAETALRLGQGLDIRVERVDELLKTRTGKTRYVISKMTRKPEDQGKSNEN